ncbi:MerR family transcriptional regulator [Streptomyces sp. NPDC004787]|uniref:MerR family transcriptional regulator n=1 Tax=Streptomyces sp. NPDC004787 TaxID=3154291 RepID=UPI0033BAEAAB
MGAEDEVWSIGELAERAGVSVKTVRYYSERGLLPEAGRTGGGHRRYGPGALERLRSIRALRALELPVTEVGRVLDQGAAWEDVVTGRLREVERRMTALRWHEASLRLLRDAPAAERAERLRLLGALAAPPDTTVLARFWRRTLPVRFPARLAAAVVDAAVPRPPADPTPAQVLAYARLHALVAAAPAPPVHLAGVPHRAAALYEGLAEAYDLAAATGPGDGGEALERFVGAYADALAARDTPAFRRRLARLLVAGADPVIGSYWQLAGALRGPGDGPTAGALHGRLCLALKRELTDGTAPGTAPGAEPGAAPAWGE